MKMQEQLGRLGHQGWMEGLMVMYAGSTGMSHLSGIDVFIHLRCILHDHTGEGDRNANT